MNGKIYWFPQIASKNGKFTDGYQILWLEILKTICRVFGKNNYKTQDTNDERHLVFTMIENFTKVSKKAKMLFLPIQPWFPQGACAIELFKGLKYCHILMAAVFTTSILV